MRSSSKRLWLVALIAIAVAATSLTGTASAKDLPAACNNHPVTASEFRTFSQSVWNRDHWERGQPDRAILDAKARKIHCAAGPGHVASMQKEWTRDKLVFVKVRKGKLWAAKFRSFEYPDGRHWAVPYPIAWCESGGDYFVGPYGAYGLIMESTYLPPKVQDEVAYNLYLEQGEGPWAPYEGGCLYR